MTYQPRKLAVECPECGYRGRRVYEDDREPPSCSKCGHLGGRVQLNWTEWR